MYRSHLSRPATQRVLAAAVAACFGSVAVAQPVGMSAIHGTASVQQAGAQTNITTTNGAGTRHSAIDWRSFSVPVDRSVYFAQPDAGSMSINRVTGPDPSSIFGTLGSNGRLVLVNPAGIAVGAGAVVDTAGFTASTLPMSTADAIAGNLRFGTGDTSANQARLAVQGEVLARNGDVVLIGPKVETGQPAVVRAQGGDVILAAGRKVYLTGRGLEGIRFEVRAPDDRALNLGRLQGDSVGIFASLLQHSGTIRAEGNKQGGGKVVLQAAQQAEVSGAIQASAPTQGGSVHVTAERLVLKSTASIDVSHAKGGGEILLGGGWQGHDARLANAQTVEVEEGVLLKADATLAGNGGTVVVWSDDSTRFGGTLTALGAGPSGAGGRAEVSGKRQLIFRGKVDLGAANGKSGELLLDPDKVTIRGVQPDGGAGKGKDEGQDNGKDGGKDDTIYESQLEAMNANVVIQADKGIEAQGPFSGNELLLANNRNLKLEVTGNGGSGITLNGMPIRTQGSGTVELRTGGGGINPDGITTAGGSISLFAGSKGKGDITLDAPLNSAGGAISLTGKKLEFDGNQAFSAGTRVNLAVDKIENKGNVSLASGVTFATNGTDFENRKDSVLAGSGLLDLGGGKLSNEGILRPGGAGTVGDLRVAGGLEMKKDSELQIDVASARSYDRLLVTGEAKLGGRLVLTAPAYAPQAADNYVVLEAGSVSKSFDKFSAPGFTGMVAAVGARNVRVARPGTPDEEPRHDQSNTDGGNVQEGQGSLPIPPVAVVLNEPEPATPAPAPAPSGIPTTTTTPAQAPAPTDPAPAPSTPAAIPATPASPAAAPAASTSPGTTASSSESAPTSANAAPSTPETAGPVRLAQAATQQTTAETASAMQQLAALPAASSEPEQDRTKRKVVVTAVACRTQ